MRVSVSGGVKHSQWKGDNWKQQSMLHVFLKTFKDVAGDSYTNQ